MPIAAERIVRDPAGPPSARSATATRSTLLGARSLRLALASLDHTACGDRRTDAPARLDRPRRIDPAFAPAAAAATDDEDRGFPVRS